MIEKFPEDHEKHENMNFTMNIYCDSKFFNMIMTILNSQLICEREIIYKILKKLYARLKNNRKIIRKVIEDHL